MTESQQHPGLEFKRHFTLDRADPFDVVEWVTVDAVIKNASGEAVFEQRGIEAPAAWSQRAIDIVASKYFRGAMGTPARENSIRQLIGRVVDRIADWARKDRYFADARALDGFVGDLKHILVNQKAAFNSPVWFNLGVEGAAQQASACYIQRVDDTMESILDLAKSEGMLFKRGSGTGTNLSSLRSSGELLASGGTASGPVSFMKGFDAFAGVIKSGGASRRAAKMVVLDVDHPDIIEFITCKVAEERKAWALIDAGYDGSLTGPAYSSVFFQNANNSVRVTDDFMRAVENDGEWQTRAVTDPNRVVSTHRARDLMRLIADSTHVCGDPGMQFSTVINDWHTSPNSGRIRASNPCGEFLYIDDTACNLASINLLKFLNDDNTFNVECFEATVRTMITAQEILVGNASYPTERITRNSHDFRPLGLGYANLGALLVALGIAYDSDEGRGWAATITALMTGEGYAQSARIARDHGGPFAGFEVNREPFLRVIRKHRDALQGINSEHVPVALFAAATRSWGDAVGFGESYGYRNAQVTVHAPTGTIGFMMDCDTTGIEPDLALVKLKKLVDGGEMKIENTIVPRALSGLGYSDQAAAAIMSHIDAHGTIEGASDLLPEHLSVFDCALKPEGGERSIHYTGHIRMVGAVQPFISGGISKTINLPSSATTEDISRAYMYAWKLGVKAVSIYRDNSKRTQPLNTSRKTDEKPASVEPLPAKKTPPPRRRLPDERHAITHRFDISGHKGYVTVGLYEDGSPGEMFISMAKEGSTLSGFADGFAQAISYALQYGVPLRVLTDKFSHARFEPSGWTRNKDIRHASSIIDYVFRWMSNRFLKSPPTPDQGMAETVLEWRPPSTEELVTGSQDAPLCSACGAIMVRAGSCHTCPQCGTTSGCG